MCEADFNADRAAVLRGALRCWLDRDGETRQFWRIIAPVSHYEAWCRIRVPLAGGVTPEVASESRLPPSPSQVLKSAAYCAFARLSRARCGKAHRVANVPVATSPNARNIRVLIPAFLLRPCLRSGEPITLVSFSGPVGALTHHDPSGQFLSPAVAVASCAVRGSSIQATP